MKWKARDVFEQNGGYLLRGVVKLWVCLYRAVSKGRMSVWLMLLSPSSI